MNEKFVESGLRIKWHKDTNFTFNKETIYEYFIEYGPICEIRMNTEKREALILFETSISIV